MATSKITAKFLYLHIVTLYLSNMKKYGLQFYLTEQKQLIRVGHWNEVYRQLVIQ